MTECMDEFDEATPLRGTYCSRLTSEEYEDQGASCTEQALGELMKQLDRNPELYKSVLKKRRREEKEEEGFMAYMKVKLWSLVGSEDASCSVSDLECQEEILKLKTNMTRAHSYAQESRGRFSQRLVEKRRLALTQDSPCSLTSTPLRRSKRKSGRASTPHVPPPPPPPPPPLASVAATTVSVLPRPPLAERRNCVNTQRQNSKSAGTQSMIGQLKGSGCRKKLKKTLSRSPGGTPLGGWAKTLPALDGVRHFNQLLIDKFRNVKSPSPTCVQASPGTFESPL